MNIDDPEGTGHPIPLDGPTPLDAAAAMPSDTLASGVMILLALTVLQRLAGFVREILFCRWLDAEQLGQWDMAFGFLMLAAPLAVLSLPGTFGRYLERYRQHGQARTFLRRTSLACAVLTALTVAALCLARGPISQLVFGDPQRSGLVLLLAVSLVSVITFNYVTSVYTSLRNMGVVSTMELVNSLMFAVLGIALMLAWRPTAASVIAAYGGACVVSSAVGLWRLRTSWSALPDTTPLPRRDLWSRLLPFTMWVMAINLLTGLFDVVDRYMIIHCSAFSPSAAMAEVGNYRSSRVVPLLLASVTAMIAGVVTPHLSHDWESGRRSRVADQMNLLLKGLSVVLTAAGVLVAAVAPLLFQVAFRGKYAGGLAVLPWTLTYCAWFGMTMIAQKYLWCAERASLASLAMGLGLAVNVSLNVVLLPRCGLLGAVLATAAANLVALMSILLLSRRLGLRVDRSTWSVLLLPMAVCLGPALGALVLLAVALDVAAGGPLLSPAEKRELADGAAYYLAKLRLWNPRRRAAGRI